MRNQKSMLQEVFDHQEFVDECLSSCMRWDANEYQKVCIRQLVREIFGEYAPHLEICTKVAFMRRGISVLSDDKVIAPPCVWKSHRDREISKNTCMDDETNSREVF